MTAQNPPTEKKLHVSAPQLASLTLIEVIEHHLATAADRLLTIGQEDAGHALGAAFKFLGAEKLKLVEKWQSRVQLASAADLPPPQAIGNKIIGGL
jgi:hypothetical protein